MELFSCKQHYDVIFTDKKYFSGVNSRKNGINDAKIKKVLEKLFVQVINRSAVLLLHYVKGKHATIADSSPSQCPVCSKE